MSAARCFSAWNEPIGTPNCSRSFRYLIVRSKHSSVEPSISAARPMRATSSVRSRMSAAPPTGPSTCVARRSDAAELNVRGVAAVGHLRARHFHAFRLAIDQEQREAVAAVFLARRARNDEQFVGHVAVEHERLLAADLVDAFFLARLRFDVVRIVAVRLFERQRDDEFAAGDASEQILFLILRACEVDRGAARPHGADQRARGQRATGLFGDDAEAFVAEREAAVFLGPGNARPAEFNHLRPRAAIESVCAVFVAQFAQLRDRCVRAAERLRSVLEHVLLFIENHRHLCPLTSFVGNCGGKSWRDRAMARVVLPNVDSPVEGDDENRLNSACRAAGRACDRLAERCASRDAADGAHRSAAPARLPGPGTRPDQRRLPRRSVASGGDARRHSCTRVLGILLGQRAGIGTTARTAIRTGCAVAAYSTSVRVPAWSASPRYAAALHR